MFGKDVIGEYLGQKSTAVAFHLPGVHTLPIVDAFTRYDIKTIQGRHESNLSFMADGYARISGRPGVLVVTPGAGLGNVVSGCIEAYNDDVPLLIIHVDIDRKGEEKGQLHEFRRPDEVFSNLTKDIFRVKTTSDLMPLLKRAWGSAVSNRNGPVLISIPFRLLEKEVALPNGMLDERKGGGKQRQSLLTDPIIEQIDAFLYNKKRPVIIAGKALMFPEARQLLDDICLGASIPLFTTTGGKGIVREDRVYAFGNIIQKGLVKDIIAKSDAVIAIGTRLRDVDSKRRGIKIGSLLHIDVDDRWFDKNYKAKLKLVGEMKDALNLLNTLLKGKRFEWDLKGLKELHRKGIARLKTSSLGFKTIDLIRQAIPEETVLVCDLNLLSYWAEYHFPVYAQNGFVMARGIAPIFYSIPAGIGVRLAMPERPCLAISGDGGALPTICELSTIKMHNIPLVILIYNNNSFGTLELAMEDRYHMKGSMELFNPDLIKIAGAFGIKAKRAKDLEGLKRVLSHDVSWDEPFLIEFTFPLIPPPWM